MKNRLLINWILLILIVLMPIVFSAVPTGPSIIYQNVENGSPRPGTSINTSGGTITTLILNGTTQNPHWKAYVGNVTGRYVLEDADNFSIYEWTITSIAGEVYVTRGSSANWGSIQCANSTHVAAEETAMQHTASADDSISNTFKLSTHDPFWTAATEFNTDECDFTLTTFVNGSAQSGTANFQELLLYDGTSLIYTAILDENKFGFDRGYYDFQMIVAEDGVDGPVSSTIYYFYVELV